MVRKIPAKLEKKLDDYAILYCFSGNGKSVNGRVVKFLRRLYRKRVRRQIPAIQYYRQSKTSCLAVKKGLEGFARSYQDLESENSQRIHDDSAGDFITAVFPEDRENVHYLRKYFLQIGRVQLQYHLP